MADLLDDLAKDMAGCAKLVSMCSKAEAEYRDAKQRYEQAAKANEEERQRHMRIADALTTERATWAKDNPSWRERVIVTLLSGMLSSSQLGNVDAALEAAIGLADKLIERTRGRLPGSEFPCLKETKP